MTARLRLVLVAALALLAPSLASAQVWPSEIRRKFVDECLASCKENTRTSHLQRAECPPVCECIVKDIQNALTPDEYLMSLQTDPAAKPYRERLNELVAACEQKHFR